MLKEEDKITPMRARKFKYTVEERYEDDDTRTDTHTNKLLWTQHGVLKYQFAEDKNPLCMVNSPVCSPFVRLPRWCRSRRSESDGILEYALNICCDACVGVATGAGEPDTSGSFCVISSQVSIHWCQCLDSNAIGNLRL